MQKKLPHLKVRDFEQSNFTTTNQGRGSNEKLPPRDRETHSEYLKNQFNQAWSQSIDQEIIHHICRRVYILNLKVNPGSNLLRKALRVSIITDKNVYDF